jgi:protein-S-isoprenylcysteine O-methyltransferase Ste14
MTLFLKNLAFTVLVPGTVAVAIPWAIARNLGAEARLGPGATLLLLLGAGIYSWCVFDFATFGRGTPAPIDAPKRLVVRGLYHYTRNPMYLGVLTTLLGWAVLFREASLLFYALCVGTAFHLFVTLYEEPHLAKTFGPGYAEYRTRVSRWIPTLGRETEESGSD